MSDLKTKTDFTRPPSVPFGKITRLPMMELRKAPGELLERIWWNGEQFILERAGKPIAFVIGYADMLGWLTGSKIPWTVPCSYCCVEIDPKGQSHHEIDRIAERIHNALVALRGSHDA